MGLLIVALLGATAFLKMTLELVGILRLMAPYPVRRTFPFVQSLVNSYLDRLTGKGAVVVRTMRGLILTVTVILSPPFTLVVPCRR